MGAIWNIPGLKLCGFKLEKNMKLKPKIIQGRLKVWTVQSTQIIQILAQLIIMTKIVASLQLKKLMIPTDFGGFSAKNVPIQIFRFLVGYPNGRGRHILGPYPPNLA